MKYLTYSEALKICKEKAEELTKKKQLKAFCDKHDLKYHAVLVYITGTKLKRYPKLVSEFLQASGYEGVKIERKVVYNFIIDSL